MSPGGGWDDAVAENLKAGFYNHSFNPISEEGPAFCIWEVREGITAEQFQEFIDSPKGPDFGLGAMMNICKEINVELAQNTPLSKKALMNMLVMIAINNFIQNKYIDNDRRRTILLG